MNSVYQHYKGGLYRVLVCDARIESNPNVDHTVYVSLQDGRVWVRPTSEFLDTVAIDGNGNRIFRFTAV